MLFTTDRVAQVHERVSSGNSWRGVVADISWQLFICSVWTTKKCLHLRTQELLFFSQKNMAACKSSGATPCSDATFSPSVWHYSEQKWRALSGVPARLMRYLQLGMAAGDAACRRTGTTVTGLKVPTHSSTCFASFWFVLILPRYGVGKSQCREKSIKIQFRIIVLCSSAMPRNYQIIQCYDS